MSGPEKSPGSAPEFSRVFIASALRPGGENVSLKATEAERAALAPRLGVEAVQSLVAEVRLQPRGAAGVAARGRVMAVLDRLCVVTLEPIVERVDEPFTVLFRPEDPRPGSGTKAAAEVTVAPDEDDIELYAGQGFDLGEIVTQTLAVAMDPWPRAPGAALPPGHGEGGEREGEVH